MPTLVEALARAGYYTGLMAKTGHVVPSRAAAWKEIVLARELKNGRSAELYLARTRAFLAKARESEQPFFLMLNVQDPHRPFAGSQQEETFKARDGAARYRRAIRRRVSRRWRRLCAVRKLPSRRLCRISRRSGAKWRSITPR